MPRMVYIDCKGYFYQRQGSTISYSVLRDMEGYCNSGTGNVSGDGGGASLVASGGSGAVSGGTAGFRAAQILFDYSSGRAGGTASGNKGMPVPLQVLRAKKIYIDGTWNFSGTTHTTNRGAGAGAGSLIAIAEDDFTIDTNGTIDLHGGNAKTSAGGVGGGGGGGLCFIRSKTYTNNGTISVVGGLSLGGTAGGAGIVDQALYNDSTMIDYAKTYFPFNGMAI
jgi:hypothetical protein